MPTFAYTARDTSGIASNGSLRAESLNEVTRLLRADGKYPVSVRPVDQADPARAATYTHGIRIRRADAIAICTQLSIMIETGVTLSEALDCIVQQADNPKLKTLVQDLSLQVQAGSDFSSALARHPHSFPRVLVALVRASEKTGTLGQMLTRGTKYLRDELETIRRVKGALTYPAIMLGFAISATTFLLTFVLPKFTAIYAARGATLPLPTRILMLFSQNLVLHWLWILTVLLTLGVATFLYLRSASGSRLWHYIQIRLPILGPVCAKLYLARGLRMVGTMAAAGVSLLDCVTTARDLCANTYFRELWDQTADKLQLGKQFSEPLFESPLVPRSVAQMMHSAEKSGKLSVVMSQVADFSEQELKERIAELTRYIEPAMIMVMGVIIGGIAMALLLPIFTISRVMAAH
jgi:type IV pilus assembly protein PilC